jgi:hypothetical protein
LLTPETEHAPADRDFLSAFYSSVHIAVQERGKAAPDIEQRKQEKKKKKERAFTHLRW